MHKSGGRIDGAESGGVNQGGESSEQRDVSWIRWSRRGGSGWKEALPARTPGASLPPAASFLRPLLIDVRWLGHGPMGGVALVSHARKLSSSPRVCFQRVHICSFRFLPVCASQVALPMPSISLVRRPPGAGRQKDAQCGR